MKIKVNPTRQELLKIKKRLKTARSGHGLLKEKLDGLMQEFLANIKNLKASRKSLDEKMSSAFVNFYKANNRVGKNRIDALMSHIPQTEVDLTFYSVMGVRIRKVAVLNEKEIEESKTSLRATDDSFNLAEEDMKKLFADIISYANLIIKVRLLAEEIEKTRRRVNSLEYIYIPEMERVIKYISQKLEERERFDRTVVLKLKEIMEKKPN